LANSNGEKHLAENVWRGEMAAANQLSKAKWRIAKKKMTESGGRRKAAWRRRVARMVASHNHNQQWRNGNQSKGAAKAGRRRRQLAWRLASIWPIKRRRRLISAAA